MEKSQHLDVYAKSLSGSIKVTITQYLLGYCFYLQFFQNG